MSKAKKVENHLLEHKEITSLQAFTLYGATRLSSIIFRLRKQGYNIDTEMKHYTTMDGETYNYGVYHLRS
jgi:hypothetical protein